jgi:hypothetical protein
VKFARDIMAEPTVPPAAPAPPPPPTNAVALVGPPSPLTYRDRLAQFRILEEKRHELIEVGPRVLDAGST